jgi:hypothetical protein
MGDHRFVKSALANVVVLTAVVAAVALPATASGMTTSSQAGNDLRLRFTFDNGESLEPGTRVRDSSGRRHHGVVRVSGRGHLTIERGVTGRAAGYPAACRGCGRAIISVNDGRGLDPLRRDFRFGVAARVTARQAKPGRDPNLVQKGLVSQDKRQWKLELIGARPKCVVDGRLGRATAMSPIPIDNGKWHRLVCSRNGPTLTLRVDGVVRATALGRTGRLANATPLRVGGKALRAAGQNDQYHGDLDNVFLRIDRAS